MSDLTAETETRRASSRRHAAPPRGLPLWASPLVVLGGALIGVLANISSGQLGMAYIVCFGIAAILATIIVEPRGLTVTVLQQPLLFYVVTPVLGWLSNRITSPDINGFPATRTLVSELLRMMYPLISLFPWVLSIFIICVTIAVVRYLAVLKQDRRIAAAHRRYLRRQERARMTTQSATRARTAASERDRANLRRQGMRREEREEDVRVRAETPTAIREESRQEETPRTDRGEAVLGAGVRKADSPRRRRRRKQQFSDRTATSSTASSRRTTSRGATTSRSDSRDSREPRDSARRQASTTRADIPPTFDRAAIERERERRREAARRREVNRQIQPDVDRGFNR
ncbi:DUF6542 domain-containing protein [Corynebacterium ulceribovis]|uniref:DUF6542 domain-containing protein n=1 Tax=Corynebacterium ulceribovis TaxID=487732 RepID=UPI00037F04DD|nr:DUF6542 domain-containing protein [Corynebacterium ulceribovis]